MQENRPKIVKRSVERVEFEDTRARKFLKILLWVSPLTSLVVLYLFGVTPVSEGWGRTIAIYTLLLTIQLFFYTETTWLKIDPYLEIEIFETGRPSSIKQHTVDTINGPTVKHMTYPEQDIPTQIINTEGSFIGKPLSEEERYLKTSRNPKEYTVQGTMRFSRTKSSQAGWDEELETPSILGFRAIPVSGHLSRKIGKATWRGKELKVIDKTTVVLPDELLPTIIVESEN